MDKDPAHLTFDLVGVSHPKVGVRLSKEIILCLRHGGVPSEVLEVMYHDSLTDTFNELADWQGEGASLRLWKAVFELENVLSARVRRGAVGLAQHWGLDADSGNLDSDDDTPEEYDEDGDEDEEDESVEDRFDEVDPSGAALFRAGSSPFVSSEQILSLLEAGFSPAHFPLLNSKLKRFIRMVIKRLALKYHIASSNSLVAYAAPGECKQRFLRRSLMSILDPFGVLASNEIFYQGSESWKNGDGTRASVLKGPVLVSIVSL